MPLVRRLLTSALVVVGASALCVCAALASPLVAKRGHPRLAIVHPALAPVSKLAPGDSAQRTLELHYRGSGRFASVVLRVRGLSHSPLGSPTVGIRLKIERCSAEWKRSETRTYACEGTRWAVLGNAAIGGGHPFRLRHLAPRAGHTDHLLLTLRLPVRAGNVLQRRLAKVVYAVTGA
jgi:hypothetical protein